MQHPRNGSDLTPVICEAHARLRQCNPDSAEDVIRIMTDAVPPSLDTLTTEQAVTLGILTRKLQSLSPQAGQAYKRFVSTSQDSLSIPPEPVGDYLCGKTIVVTGAGGSIGSILLKELAALDAAEQIIGISRYASQIPVLVAGVEYVDCDLKEPESVPVLRRLGAHVVYHLAADRTRNQTTFDNNVRGMNNILAAAAGTGAQVVFASSERARIFEPFDPYIASKREGERHLYSAAGEVLCSAARIAHVTDGSNLIRAVKRATGTCQPVRIALDGPSEMHIQSARQAAGQLLCATVEAEPGKLMINAIRDLGPPINILDVVVGAMIEFKTWSEPPIYFSKVPPEINTLMPVAYNPHVSPALSSAEIATAQPSPLCEQLDNACYRPGGPREWNRTF